MQENRNKRFLFEMILSTAKSCFKIVDRVKIVEKESRSADADCRREPQGLDRLLDQIVFTVELQ